MGKDKNFILIKSGKKSMVTDTKWCEGIIKDTVYDIQKASDKFESLTTFARKGKVTLQRIEPIFKMIDKLWFDGELIPKLTKVYGGINVHVNIDKTVVAGYVIESAGGIDLFLNSELFDSLFKNGETGYHTGGLLCTDKLICLLHVLLHETVHVVLTLCESMGKYKDVRHHGKDFDRITNHLFGHTDSKHGLIVGLNHAYDLDTIKNSIRVGQKVNIFLDFRFVEGKVTKRGKSRVDIDTGKDVYSVHMGLVKIFPTFIGEKVLK
jgi:hypothetical protein